jgi:hypothetical protein
MAQRLGPLSVLRNVAQLCNASHLEDLDAWHSNPVDKTIEPLWDLGGKGRRYSILDRKRKLSSGFRLGHIEVVLCSTRISANLLTFIPDLLSIFLKLCAP